MSDPVIVEITPADVWVPVAIDVVAGFVHALAGPVRYNYTYRDTGGDVPTDSEEGVSFSDCGFIEIAAVGGIDVYVMALGAVGKVRVDL